jgi:hypothetical protein
MDALTRERFAPGRRTVVTDEILARRLVLLGVDDTSAGAEQAQMRRLRADALVRSRRLARSIRMYQVRASA